MTVDRKSVHDIAARLEAAFNASDAVTLASLVLGYRRPDAAE